MMRDRHEPTKSERSNVWAAQALTGIALMTAASLLVPAVDGIAKALGSNYSPFLVAWARYTAASVIVVPATLVFYRGRYDIRPDFISNVWRTILTVAAMTCFFFAITYVPLATAFGGYFLGPIIAATLAVLLLGEKLTWPRLFAGLLGLAGAFLIVKPGAEVNVGSLLAVASGALFAGYLIVTRNASNATPPIDALRFQCVFGALMLTPLAVVNWSPLTQEAFILIATMGTLSAICHLMVIAAFRFTEISVLSSLTYLELISATVIGWLFFHELPDRLATAGIALVVGSGLIVWAAEHRRLRRPRR